MTETWQEMAARLGVELRKKMVRDGYQLFCKNRVRIGIGRPSESPAIEGDQFCISDPIEARDLSDCLQVAARYLEEVHG